MAHVIWRCPVGRRHRRCLLDHVGERLATLPPCTLNCGTVLLDEEGHELKLEFADAIFEDLVMDAVGALDRAEAIRNRL